MSYQPPRYGAEPTDWNHLAIKLRLLRDLLPVVSNPQAKISPDSTMHSLGKTPSQYNKNRRVVGIPKWTQQVTTREEVKSWLKEPDYGICVQTRVVRALDIDVDDLDQVKAIKQAIGDDRMPVRYRNRSAKCLLLFRCAGDLPKRVIKTDKGIIELLGTGQQFVACGTHLPSGDRYVWDPAIEEIDEIPELTLQDVDALWGTLESQFAIEKSSVASSTLNRSKVLSEAIGDDPVARYLIAEGWVKSAERDGRLHIRCPFEAEHTSESADSATTYFPAHTGGFQHGHFDCRHAHCQHRTDNDFKAAVGLPVSDPADDFEVIREESKPADAGSKTRFQVIPAVDFASVKPQDWLVKNVIPRGELGVVYGESGSGKSFWVLDLVSAVVRGEKWRGDHVIRGRRGTTGRVVYVAAEGSGGMRARLRALSVHGDIDLHGLPLGVIPDAPNFMRAPDVKQVIEAINAFGDVDLVVIDTFAQVMAGANENAGEDVGKALAHCRAVHRSTGAMVLLIHHSGKDASKGARGWSGLRAAADVEIEILRDEDERVAVLTKLKDGIDGAEMGFKLTPVCIGTDEDGDPITSCIVVHTEAPARVATTRQAPKGSNERLVMRVLAGLAELGDDGVPYHTLLESAVAQMPFDAQAGKRDRRRELAAKAVDKLRDADMLTVSGDLIKLKEK